MGLITTIKRWIGMLFKTKAEDVFNVQSISSAEMDAYISRCGAVYRGRPDWVDPDAGIKTINFAKTITSETARLTVIGANVTVEGDAARANWLKEQIEKCYPLFRHWVEYGLAYGTVIIKPNGEGFDLFTPSDFFITAVDGNGRITGIVFCDRYEEGTKHYTRLEYHRYIKQTIGGEVFYPYFISNRAYVSQSGRSIGDPISLDQTRWAGLAEDMPGILTPSGETVDPIFGVFRTPEANNIDIGSPMGLPIFSGALEELKDLDVAYSRNAGEIYDSEKIILLDADTMTTAGSKARFTPEGMEIIRERMKLPHYVKNVQGNGRDMFYEEIVPTLNTEARIKDINHLLSIIGFKCGYSNGYFVFDEKTGMVTATQVEADDRRTIQLIRDCQDKLKHCIIDAMYAMNLYANLYGLAPAGNVKKIDADFGDITENLEEDRQRWWKYVQAGSIPKYWFFTNYEGLSEEEAKRLIQEAKEENKEPDLYSKFTAE